MGLHNLLDIRQLHDGTSRFDHELVSKNFLVGIFLVGSHPY
jgi:hypothetical protein